MPADRRADYRAYDLVRRHELEIVVRLLEEILPEMPKPRAWSHQPHVGRPGPHRRGRPERFPWEPMAKALGLMPRWGGTTARPKVPCGPPPTFVARWVS